MAWIDVLGADELTEKGRAVARVDGRQIALFKTERGIFACNNRCPHEGYPLSQGSMAEGCVLTCNWHNWKFDLASGETLVGGDELRRYPVRLRKGRIEIDVTEPPAEVKQQHALASLDEAIDDVDYQRIAREIARLEHHGGDGLDAFRRAIRLTHDRYEFGMSHAYAVAADWLDLRTETDDMALRLVALVEAIAHMADDAEGEERYPFPRGRRRGTRMPSRLRSRPRKSLPQ